MLRAIIIMIISCSGIVRAQHVVLFKPTDKPESAIKDYFNKPVQVSDTNAVELTYNKLLAQLFSQGYVNAHIISVEHKIDTSIINLFTGSPVKWGKINVPDDVLSSRDLARFRSLSGKIISIKELDVLFNQLITYYENNGYPFASVRLNSITQEENKLYAQLEVNTGKLIIIDSVAVTGDVLLTNRYIQNYLGIKNDAVYNEEFIRGISRKINELPFIELAKQPSVSFYAERAIVTLYLKNKNANRFDFILGVLPNSTLQATPGRLLITGDVQLNLYNALSFGEQVSVRFEKFQARTTRAKARIVYPYVLSSPFGLDAGFNLFVNDSIFRNLEYDFGVQYSYSGSNYIKGYYKRFESRIIYVDTSLILFTKKLPATLDVNNSTYGVEYALDKTDFRFNPRKGFGLILNVAVGLRRIEPNNKIVNLTDPINPEFYYRSLYDSIQNKGNQYRATFRFYKYWPLANHSAIKTQMDLGYIIGKDIVVGELFRLGGNKFLRGFDEESILVSNYQILNLEYRLLLDQYSFLSVFTDQGIMSRFTNLTDYTTIYTAGVGAGFTFQTKAGLFNLNYALGRTNNSSFSFRAAKIHFGYINIF